MIIAASPRDVVAEGISRIIAGSEDLQLVGNRVFALEEIAAALKQAPGQSPCALVLVGEGSRVRAAEAAWLDESPRLFVVRVEVPGFRVRFALNDPDLKLVLESLRQLVAGASPDPQNRVSHVRLQTATAAAAPEVGAAALMPRPMLAAAIAWLRALLGGTGLDLAGDAESPAPAGEDANGREERTRRRVQQAEAADHALSAALRLADNEADPLCWLMRCLQLTPLEIRFVLLALAPELDVIFQQGYARLQGDVNRRVGTLGFYAALLGDPVEVRRELTASTNLVRWRLLDGVSGARRFPCADELLRLDAPIVEWLMGDADGLANDARLRRVLRPGAWPGASLVEDAEETRQVAGYLQLLQQPLDAARHGPRWLLFNGDQTLTWYASLERAAQLLATAPLRVQCERLATLEALENGETAHRLARLARLTHRPLLLDAVRVDGGADADEAMRQLFIDIAATRCRAGIVCGNVSRFIGLLGLEAVRVVPDSCMPQQARRRSLKAATERLGLALNDELLESLESQLPLQADGWERALQLTCARRMPEETPAQLTPRFVAACRDVASQAVSTLAERIDPRFRISQVVLPAERTEQLWQIVHGVKFARRVLDEWRFGEQLAYGRGVSALLHGPSGTGKTMAALAIAKELGSQVLRIDLSRVVSKYIGETEKHLDTVFRDAEQCGAVLLIDEAEALLGKRGEIKDAHDRYAAIEVAYLLTRIESYAGVSLFTTNARQNIDPAFLRRLRFIIDFPRPDVSAREQIWRRCLPPGAHALDDAAFRQLARKCDLTGGHIRQITLQAAFLAAAQQVRIDLGHISHASRAELAKLGLPPIALDAIAPDPAARSPASQEAA